MCGWKNGGTATHKSIVVSFLPCLVAFLGFHPYMVLHFFCNFISVRTYPLLPFFLYRNLTSSNSFRLQLIGNFKSISMKHVFTG